MRWRKKKNKWILDGNHSLHPSFFNVSFLILQLNNPIISQTLTFCDTFLTLWTNFRSVVLFDARKNDESYYLPFSLFKGAMYIESDVEDEKIDCVDVKAHE